MEYLKIILDVDKKVVSLGEQHITMVLSETIILKDNLLNILDQKYLTEGLIENNTNTNDSYGQGIHGGNGGYSYNYGIRILKVAILRLEDKNSDKGQAYNYGVTIDFRNSTETGIFRNNVENKGIVIYDTTGLNLGTGKNKGVVLDSSFKLTANVNSHVTDLATGTIDGANDKTYYTSTNTKDTPKEFNNNLTNDVLTSVITAENGTAFKYNGENLTLTDTTVVGCFENQGTLLSRKKFNFKK